MKKRIFLPPFLFVSPLPAPSSCLLLVVDTNQENGSQAIEAVYSQGTSTAETANLEYQRAGERLIFQHGTLIKLPKTEQEYGTRH